MKKLLNCPVCSGNKNTTIGINHNRLKEPPQDIRQAEINAILGYVIYQDTLITKTIFCRTCRHLFMSPTFEEEELNRLYSHECEIETKKQYRKSEHASGKSWIEQNKIDPLIQESRLRESKVYRPMRMLRLIEAATGKESKSFSRICDIGGRSGELTAEFVYAQRFLYDKDTSSKSDPGVLVLKSMEEVVQNGPYDLLVLSHVLEHIPFPVEFIESLNKLLSPEGVIYVEVPIEYCGAIIKRRGITLGPHINYFTRSSLRHCVTKSGLGEIKLVQCEIAPYGELRMPVIKIIAGHTLTKNTNRVLRYPWFLEMIFDVLLIFRARFCSTPVWKFCKVK